MIVVIYIALTDVKRRAHQTLEEGPLVQHLWQTEVGNLQIHRLQSEF